MQHSEKEAAAVSEVENGSSVSRFHVAPILDQDGGEISCEVANRFGRDSKTFLLSIEGKLIVYCTLLWTFVLIFSDNFSPLHSYYVVVHFTAADFERE